MRSNKVTIAYMLTLSWNTPLFPAKRNYLIKVALLLLPGFIFTYKNLSAQGVTGVFLTDKDLMEDKLSYSSQKACGCKIKIRSNFSGKKIKITCGNAISYLNKDSVYGYKDKEGKMHRFYKGMTYTLINKNEEIRFYTIQLSNPTKYQAATLSYFFSRTLSSAIYPLKIDNILTEFSDNIDFCKMIELRYKTDSELTEFDSYHKKYKLNRLLEISKN